MATEPRPPAATASGELRLRYSINVTLDCCCDHEVIAPSEELHRHHAANLGRADALLFGRVTYEMMEAAWRQPATGSWPAWMPDWMIPFAETIGRAKKYVVSSTLDRLDWNAELVQAWVPVHIWAIGRPGPLRHAALAPSLRCSAGAVGDRVPGGRFARGDRPRCLTDASKENGTSYDNDNGGANQTCRPGPVGGEARRLFLAHGPGPVAFGRARRRRHLPRRPLAAPRERRRHDLSMTWFYHALMLPSALLFLILCTRVFATHPWVRYLLSQRTYRRLGGPRVFDLGLRGRAPRELARVFRLLDHHAAHHRTVRGDGYFSWATWPSPRPGRPRASGWPHKRPRYTGRSFSPASRCSPGWSLASPPPLRSSASAGRSGPKLSTNQLRRWSAT
jgi:hypothetical protein